MPKLYARAVLAASAAYLMCGAVLAQDVTGAGASFPAPIYAKWADAYHKASGARINYQSVGSGAGVRQVKARTVDFGATDAPLADEELAREGLIQFPMVIGGVVPVVNIAGVAPGQLELSGAVLADIYLGRIKRWNDPAIAALNPGLSLPDAAIAPITRADGSGTSFLFTHYLSQASAEWKAQVGEGTTVKWPTGVGGKGNEGVSAFVQRLPHSIGYVEYAYAKQNKMSHVLLKNKHGHFVAPDDDSFKAAAEGADWAKSFRQVLTDQPGKNSWPITGATFILLHQTQDKPATAAAALKFFDWVYTHGDKAAAELDYVALPAKVKDQARKLWSERLKDAAGKALAAN